MNTKKNPEGHRTAPLFFGDPSITVPDEVMGPLDIKKLLVKWVSFLCDRMRYALIKYYIGAPSNIDTGCLSVTKLFFESAHTECESMVRVLEDMIARRYTGMEGAVEAVYGQGSRELFVCNEFYRLYSCIDSWDETKMWTNDENMANILLINIGPCGKR